MKQKVTCLTKETGAFGLESKKPKSRLLNSNLISKFSSANEYAIAIAPV
jgi:hypothetical protein